MKKSEIENNGSWLVPLSSVPSPTYELVLDINVVTWLWTIYLHSHWIGTWTCKKIAILRYFVVFWIVLQRPSFLSFAGYLDCSYTYMFGIDFKCYIVYKVGIKVKYSPVYVTLGCMPTCVCVGRLNPNFKAVLIVAMVKTHALQCIVSKTTRGGSYQNSWLRKPSANTIQNLTFYELASFCYLYNSFTSVCTSQTLLFCYIYICINVFQVAIF